MFFWRVSTFLDCLEAIPSRNARRADGVAADDRHAAILGRTCDRIYPRLENISVDYAMMEPATRPGSCVAGVRDSRGRRLERHRFLGGGLRTARAEAREQMCRAGPHAGARCAGKFFLEPEEVCRGDRRSRPGGRGDGGRVADLSARALAGRGQSREVARGTEGEEIAVRGNEESELVESRRIRKRSGGNQIWHRRLARRDRRGFHVRERAQGGARDRALRGARGETRQGMLVGYDTRFGSERFRARGRGSGRRHRNAGVAGCRCLPDAGALAAGAAARRGGRNSDHREPQSLSLERDEIQGELRKLGVAVDRRANRKRTGEGACRRRSAVCRRGRI